MYAISSWHVFDQFYSPSVGSFIWKLQTEPYIIQKRGDFPNVIELEDKFMMR